MPESFIIRPMTLDDGEAVRHLMEDDPLTGRMQMTTKFQVDPVKAWNALKPDMAGAVAVDGERVLGTATVAFEDIRYNGRVLPSAYLENLKVHHAARGRGIGTALAEWRVEQARARFGKEGVIVTGTSTDNIASQNTMKKWANQFFSPLTLTVRPALHAVPTPPAGFAARAATPSDYAQIADKSNRYYADFHLSPPMSPEWLDHYIGHAPQVYSYHVVQDASGALVAGAMASLRAALMHDEIRNIPPVLRFVNNRLLHIVPSDGMLRALEVNFVWHEHLGAAHYLWKYLRWVFREQAASISANFDPRGPLGQVFQIKRWHMPKISLLVALHGPEMMDTHRPVCGTLRG